MNKTLSVKKIRMIVFAIFFISVGLRLALACINREANDYHMEIINRMVDMHQIPEKGDCWECFQPKFFYVLSAGIVTIFDIHSIDNRIIAIQFLNVILGFFTLLFFWKFIKKQTHFSTITQLLFFAFFAFNPCLAGINIQATNDTFEILCGVMAVYFCDSFFRNYTLKDFIFLLVSVFAAALTKATGILLFIVIVALLGIKIFSQRNTLIRLRLSRFLGTAIISFLCIIIVGGGYYTYYKKYNGLPSCGWEKAAPPAFFKDEKVTRPGITSIKSGYLTFRYFDMIRQPYVSSNDNYPLHRTSLWSQLYGRTVFMHFDQWPPSWQTQAPLIIFTGRVLILLGIIPLLLFLWGLYRGAFNFFKNIFQRGRAYLAEDNNYIHVAITMAFLAAVVRYSYDYRDFSTMKSIYIFPGFISYIKLFMDGYASVKRKILTTAINTVLLIIIAFSIVDIGHLVYQLSYRF